MMMTIGIVGSGAMGAGIAQVVAQAGHPVRLFDQDPAALARATAGLRANLRKLADKGKLTAEAAAAATARISPAATLAELAGCGLVLEAIVEKLDVKQALFRQLEAVVGADCLLATNTSSLSVTAIAAACQQPARCVGIHFFNPAPVLPLVEVVAAAQTRPGLADIATIDWALTELGGFRMGPFALMDFIGHDVNFRVTEAVFAAFFFDPRYRPSFRQQQLLLAGYLGRKTGRGFYDYAPGAELPTPTRDAALGQRIVQRVLAMLINEAADALYLGVASAPDLETAMTAGVNYPQGLLAWANELGPPQVLATLDGLFAEYHDPRYRASPLLRRLASSQQLFSLT